MGSLDLGKAKDLVTSTFLDSCNDFDENEIANRIVEAEQIKKELKIEQESHEELQAAKQIVKDLNSSFRAATQYEDAKIQVLLAKLEELQANTKGEG